ncbi:MAG: alkane 1-monooxygenase [Burkholderiales bacterium]|nr:alkane 1-monooxygenase [Burkholderiales bacterium]MDE2433442.1 alkane 1-monooxygenase [Burkholderiales bacterium]
MSAILPLTPSHPPTYRDRKRWLWAMPLFMCLLVLAGPTAHMLGATSQFWFFAPALFSYIGIMLMDVVIGEDLSNPPEEAVPQLETDAYYRWVIYLTLPVMWACTAFTLYYLSTHDLPWYSWLITVITCGTLMGALGLAISHELGHKRDALSRKLGLIQAALVGYGHFSIEHNRGHHRHVATPEDPASSQLGESIYRFMFRELPGAYFRAWDLECERLERLHKSPWSFSNEILQGALITICVYGSLIAWLGSALVPALTIMIPWGAFQLTSANYIEHYGLKRLKLANGRYEPCRPHHSWNSNLIASNVITFHLQRHSDHHANPTRGYQSLRNFEELPTLPTGYLGMFLIAYIPPLWFSIMNPRVIEATGGDVDRINFVPGQRERLMRRYGLAESPKTASNPK